MILKTLVENQKKEDGFKNKHGLSFFVETNNTKILFDLGSNDLFTFNADRLNVNISKIDILIISHGHIDHGGALETFIRLNKKAKIYIRESAFDNHFTKFLGIKIDIGLDKKLKYNSRIIFTKDIEIITNNIILFSNITPTKLFPTSNNKLFKSINNISTLDDFKHEQNLIIIDNHKNILITGCSHTGITNIMDMGKSIIDDNFDIVIGGFHLYNPVNRKKEKNEVIDKLTDSLCINDSIYYTCHCTGKYAYNRMKKQLKNNLHYLYVGDVLNI